MRHCLTYIHPCSVVSDGRGQHRHRRLERLGSGHLRGSRAVRGLLRHCWQCNAFELRFVFCICLHLYFVWQVGFISVALNNDTAYAGYFTTGVGAAIEPSSVSLGLIIGAAVGGVLLVVLVVVVACCCCRSRQHSSAQRNVRKQDHLRPPGPSRSVPVVPPPPAPVSPRTHLPPPRPPPAAAAPGQSPNRAYGVPMQSYAPTPTVYTPQNVVYTPQQAPPPPAQNYGRF
jgi:hypothetical protein